MKQPKKLILFIFIVFLISSCEQEYFDLTLYTAADNLTPTVYLPISSGDYQIKDYTSIPENGNSPVNTPQIKLDSIKYDLTGLEFNTAAIDTLFMVVRSSNTSPMQYQYSLIFEVLDAESSKVELKSNILPGGMLDGAGHVTAASKDSTTFILNNPAYQIVSKAKRYTLLITLIQPNTGVVIANELKNGKIGIKIAYRAPVDILKL